MSDFWSPPPEDELADPDAGADDKPREPSTRLIVALAAAAAVLLVGTALAVPYGLGLYREATRPTLDSVKIYSVRSDHTEREVEYDPAPAPGGPHDPRWLECGIYDEPVRDENAVHSLEHGTVWITYDPDRVGDGEVDTLADVLPDKGILSPYPDQAAPVIVTVWGAQLELDGGEDDRLALFLTEYGDGHTAPEPTASCAGGVEVLDSESDPGVKV